MSYLCKRNMKNYTKPRVSRSSGFFISITYNEYMISIISKEQPTPKIGTKEMEMKYSLHIQYAGTLSTKEVVAFAAKHTGMQSTAMKAALDSCCQTIELFLSMGSRVDLGELGTFFATTNGTTVYSNVDAGLSQLKRLRVRFDANKELKQAVNSAEKRLVAIQKLVDPEKKIYQTISTNGQKRKQTWRDTCQKLLWAKPGIGAHRILLTRTWPHEHTYLAREVGICR